jgi:hypothetical protein
MQCAVNFRQVQLGCLFDDAASVETMQHRVDDKMINECVTFGRISVGRGNGSTRRRPTPVPLCPPQIPHDMFSDRNQAPAVGIQRLTA